MPTVSVLMPVFNRERYVGEAIQSVLDQDFQDFELVVVDDGSTDATPDVLRQFARRDPRVTVVTSPVNLGIPGALNLGLEATRAELVARLDSDDILLPRRLAAQVAVLQSRPDVTLVSCAYEVIDAEGRKIGMWRVDEPHEVIAYLLNFFNIVGGGGQVMFRRADVLAEGGYSLRYPSTEDFDLWIKLAHRGRIHTLPFAGMRKRQHAAGSLSRYGSLKHGFWLAIMSDTLGRYLGRAMQTEEIEALITLWREDGAKGRSALADDVMREAFARFCREHPERDLQRRVRRRTARQWAQTARRFLASGDVAEAMKYLARGVRWSTRGVAVAAALSLGRLARAALRRAAPARSSRDTVARS